MFIIIDVLTIEPKISKEMEVILFYSHFKKLNKKVNRNIHRLTFPDAQDITEIYKEPKSYGFLSALSFILAPKTITCMYVLN